MYGHVGLRATLVGASASGVAGAVGVHDRVPAPLRPLLLLATGGLALYLSASVALLVLAVAFRVHAGRGPAPDRTLWPTSGNAVGTATVGCADAQAAAAGMPALHETTGPRTDSTDSPSSRATA